MKILFVCQYYPPESNAPAVRTSEMAARWVAAGHETTVLTAFPHHPDGIIPAEYRGMWFRRETREGVAVTRTWIYVAPNKGIVRRSVSYVSWMLSAILIGVPRTARPDVVVATSPQFLCAVAGYVISRLKRVPFVLEVRDLWPDSILAVGALREGFAIRVLRRIETFLYKRADRIVIVSPPFADHIARHTGRSKIFYLPNGVDLERFRTGPPARDPYAENGIHARFRVLYSGTVGMAHGLEIFIEAGERYRDDPELAFVIVGAGARRDELEAAVRERGLTNVFLIPMQPREALIDWIRGASVVVVHLKKSPSFEGVLPSKLFEYMACGKAVLIGVLGPGAEIVRSAGCGWDFEPENVAQLADRIERARRDPDETERRGRRGRTFVEEHHDRTILARRYLEEILIPLKPGTDISGRRSGAACDPRIDG